MEGCDRICLCRVLDKHSVAGFLTVLPLCDRERCCPTLYAIHRREDVFLHKSSIKKNSKKEDKDNAKCETVITPHVCPRFVMFAAVVIMNLFFYTFWSYILISRGDYNSVRDGSENDNVADLRSRFGGRSFGDVSKCFADNNAQMTFKVLPKTEAERFVRNSSCNLDVLNRYYTECRVPASMQRIAPQQCKKLGCKDAISNLFSCLVVSKNETTELFTALSQCTARTQKQATKGNVKFNKTSGRHSDEDESGKSKMRSGGDDSSDAEIISLAEVGVPLTMEQSKAIPKLRDCIMADCQAQSNEMAIQLVSTIVLTSILTMIFEKIINTSYGSGEDIHGNCCGRACSRQSFCMWSGLCLGTALTATLAGTLIGAQRALNKLRSSAPQRCIYSTPLTMFEALLETFIPVLVMGWGTQLMTLMVSEWWNRRKMVGQGQGTEAGGRVAMVNM